MSLRWQGTAPPAHSFLLVVVLLFAGIAMLALSIPLGSRLMMAVSFGPLALAGAWRLGLAIARPERYWSLCDIHGAGLLIAYFGGAALTLGLSQSGLIQAVRIPEFATVFNASLYIVFFALCLFFCGRIEAGFWGRFWHDRRDEPWPLWVLAVIAGIALAQAWFIVDGTITYQGTGTIDGKRVPVAATLIVALSWPLAGMLGWILGSRAMRSNPLFLFGALGLLPVQVVFSLAHGRRIILFQVLIFLCAFVWSRGRGFRIGQLAAIGIAAVPVIYILWVAFLGLRIEGYLNTAPVQETRSIFTRMESASQLLRSRWDTVVRWQKVEVVDRTYVLGFVIDLMNGAKVHNPYYGRQLVAGVVQSLPYMLFKGKDATLAALGTDQAGIAARYGLLPTDRADSIVTSAYLDFRWLGPPIYAAIAFAFAAVMAFAARLVGRHCFTVYVICYVFFFGLGVEQFFVTNGLNMLRTVAIAVLPLYACRLFARARPLPA